MGFPRSVNTTSFPALTALIALEKLWLASLNPMRITISSFIVVTSLLNVSGFSWSVKLRTVRRQRQRFYLQGRLDDKWPGTSPESLLTRVRDLFLRREVSGLAELRKPALVPGAGLEPAQTFRSEGF